MNKKVRAIILVYFVIILLGASYPFIFLSKNQLQIGLDIIRTLSTLVASLIVLLYFDPFGVKKKNIEKQYENVTKILEQLIGQRIFIKCETNQETLFNWKLYLTQFYITKENIFNPYITYYYRLEEIKDYPIFIEVKDFTNSQAELIKLKNNIWTPQIISKKIEFLEFKDGTTNNEKPNVIINVSWSEYLSTTGHYTDIINGKIYTIDYFFKSYKELITACETWLANNSFSKENINI